MKDDKIKIGSVVAVKGLKNSPVLNIKEIIRGTTVRCDYWNGTQFRVCRFHIDQLELTRN